MSDAASQPSPDEPAFDVAALERAILRAPIEAREQLARHFTPAALGKARRADRDGVLVSMTIGRWGDAKALAQAVHKDLMRYAASAWRFDQDRAAPFDEKHTLAHRALKLSDGAVLSERSLRRVFAELPKRPGLATAPAMGRRPRRREDL